MVRLNWMARVRRPRWGVGASVARRRLRALLWVAGSAGVLASLVYGTVWGLVGREAHARLTAPPAAQADAALVLGNRAFLRGRPNPCLTGRVDAGVALAQAGQVPLLVMSGGVDHEDGRVEARVMERRARADGYAGPIVEEPTSQSTRQNLAFSLPLLQQRGVRRVIIVSEPYHLWRIQRLVRANGFDRAFDEVQYAAAPTACWRSWGMFYKGALREPVAVIHNALMGYF